MGYDQISAAGRLQRYSRGAPIGRRMKAFSPAVPAGVTLGVTAIFELAKHLQKQVFLALIRW